MFIDSSVMVAMMSNEDEARHFARRMQASAARMTSPAAAAKAVIDVAAGLGLPIADAGDALRTFLQLMNIQLLAVPPRAAFLAAEAYGSFGAGRHPANLNFDECMTYACACYYRQPLLFKNGGFGETDIEAA